MNTLWTDSLIFCQFINKQFLFDLKRARTKNEEDEGEESEYDEDGKRKITYKMSKNKGFIPKRQKKRRNPRVKHRGKLQSVSVKRSFLKILILFSYRDVLALKA